MTYEKIPEEQYRRAIGQLRLALNDVFKPFNCYGLNIFVSGAIEEVIELAEKFGKRVRKKDIAISLGNRRNPRDG